MERLSKSIWINFHSVFKTFERKKGNRVVDYSFPFFEQKWNCWNKNSKRQIPNLLIIILTLYYIRNMINSSYFFPHFIVAPRNCDDSISHCRRSSTSINLTFQLRSSNPVYLCFFVYFHDLVPLIVPRSHNFTVLSNRARYTKRRVSDRSIFFPNQFWEILAFVREARRGASSRNLSQLTRKFDWKSISSVKVGGQNHFWAGREGEKVFECN